MSAPIIKVYELPDGYSQSGDNDVQYTAADELIPVTPKLDLLANVLNNPGLTPVSLVNNQPLICFNKAAGQTTETLIPNPAQAGYYIPTTTPWTSVLYQPYGALGIVVEDASSNAIVPTQYNANQYGIQFTGATVGATITFYKTAAIGASDTFALLGDTLYTGVNDTWNMLTISKDGGPYLPATVPAAATGTSAFGTGTLTVGYLTITGVAIGVTGRYAFCENPSTSFIAENYNWIAEHMQMWPDVFVGLENYPGDSYLSTDGTTLIDPGPMPDYQPNGTYTLNYREGTVTFPATVDGVANPVRVNASVATGINNVTGQILDPIPTRALSAWYSATTFTVALALGTSTYQVSLYMVDWTNSGRSQTVEVETTGGGQILAGQIVSNFSGGTWLKFTLTGTVNLVFTKTAGPDCVVSAIALDTTTTTGNSVIGFDSTTGGSPGVYGKTGIVLVGGETALPTNVTATPTGNSTYTWAAAGATQDARAIWLEATVFAAASETIFPASHGKQWVNRTNAYMPINIYANGQPTPVISTTDPFDTLGILTGP